MLPLAFSKTLASSHSAPELKTHRCAKTSLVQLRALADPSSTPSTRATAPEPRHTQRALMACLRAALLAASAGALVIPTQPILTRYAAGKVLEAAELKAKDEDWPVTICVCDGGGVPLCLARLDGAFPASVTLATEKARTAAQFRKPTLDLESAANDKRPALIASGYTVLGGGEPIFVDGYCVGAVGVSGVLPTEDAEVAKAGAAAVCPTTAPPDVPAKAVAFEA